MPPSRSGPLFIGIDVGTSSVKALMAGPGGERVALCAADHATARSAPGMAEQDPGAWIGHVDAALARFAAHPRSGEVAAIGVTSQVNTHVFCDRTGAALHPALTWQDTRPADTAARLDAGLSAEAKIAALGAPIPIDASHALSRMAWMAETRPAIWDQTDHVLLPKEFVIARLTGQIAGDPISAVGLMGTDLGYAGAVLGLMPGSENRLPPLADPLDIVGRMSADRPFAGLPVAAGTMDAWAGMFGLGVASDGEAMYLSGTSEVLGLLSRRGEGAPGIVTFPPWRGLRLHAGPTQSGGASLAWLAGVTGQSVADLGAHAGAARIGAESPLFLPHLDGERAPLWDPASRGAFVGLTSSTGSPELAASVMEGVAFSARLALEAVEAAAGVSVEVLRHGGGGAASDAWCRIRADALGRRLERVAAPEPGALGALVMAAVASGELGDLATATRALVASDRAFDPEPRAAGLAADRFAAFQELYRASGRVTGLLGGF